MKEKKEKGKSVFQIAREMEEAQRKLEEEAERKAMELAQQEAEEKRIAYEKQLREERIELMRLKQGVIEESDTIHEERKEEKKYTFWQRVSNFFYHNKWWMGLASFFVVLGGILIYQYVTTDRPDMVILLLVDDDEFDIFCSDNICTLFEQYIEDENGDGEVMVEVYFIPTSDDAYAKSSTTGSSTRLFSEFQLGQSLLVISDADADGYIVAEENLEDLTPHFGNYEETAGPRFYLSGTEFAKAVGWEKTLDQDIYIGIREVKPTFSFEAEMQKNYDIAFPALQKFVEEYGTPVQE